MNIKKNILIVYGSTTGNTENLSIFCKNILEEKYNIDILNVTDIKQNYSFENKYNHIILCASTWGVEPATLQEDFEIFWLNLNKASILGKHFTIIGLGDDYYPHFAEAVNILEEEINKYNGIINQESLKLQDPWEDSKRFLESSLRKLS